MSGGAFKNSSNLLGRKREMEELEEACKKALTTVDKIQAETIFQEGIFQEKSGELENVKSDLQKKYLEENFPEQYPAGYFEREDQTGKNAQEITA